jgi:acyl carrier protein
MNTPEIIEQIRTFVVEEFLYARPDLVIEADDPLMAKGVIDSMGVVELLEFIQEEFGIVVEDEEITEENLGTLSAIANFVSEKRDAVGSSAKSG